MCGIASNVAPRTVEALFPRNETADLSGDGSGEEEERLTMWNCVFFALVALAIMCMS